MIALILNAYRLLKAIVRSWDDPHFRGGLLLCGLILLSGTLFYSSVEGWHWVDALYFSATTLSTVGFGDLSPATKIGKVFTVIYIFVGVGVFIAMFIQFAKALLRDPE
ncbi:potassium channel family protein [Ruegeria arenilitoris]|uniref:potassium channel family protein n=1 Tax=Ruegeria arenilitoris TaxID=1173585 RepID=UPI00147D5A30|nr:potassium channel family protein [Ruegeria arenilitoris]